MKKSLNNTIRGKRLVVGDENEVTSHEILVEDKEGKIALKQRSSDGNIETLSGGESGYNIWYYCYGIRTKNANGMTNGQEYAVAPYRSFKDFLFSTEKVVDDSLFLGTQQITKVAILPVDSNVQIGYSISTDARVEIKINAYTEAKGLAIPNYSDIALNIPIYMKYPICIEKTIDTLQFQVYTFSYFGEVASISKNMPPLLYDVASNILFYFSGSSSMEITINPELESTLRLVNMGYSNTSNPYVNGNRCTWTKMETLSQKDFK